MSGCDSIVLIPTGGGKTVVYTLPCIITAGLGVVVSPLIMLMGDQVTRLRRHGINTCYFNTKLSESERRNILHNLVQDDCVYQFIFVSPEAVVTEQFQSCLHHLNKNKKLSSFVIDEAHCIDTWGQEFRSVYQQLGILKTFNVPVAALTGRATNHTVDVMKDTLQMTNPIIIRMPCRTDEIIWPILLLQKRQ